MARYLNPHFHWCAGCWKWVCDCVHCVEPLNIKRQPAQDIQIRSVVYDRRRGDSRLNSHGSFAGAERRGQVDGLSLTDLRAGPPGEQGANTKAGLAVQPGNPVRRSNGYCSPPLIPYTTLIL
jgi:hypothetical protein